MKFGFGTPEPSVAFAGLELGFSVFSRENAYHGRPTSSGV